jgi:uncharacterized protein
MAWLHYLIAVLFVLIGGGCVFLTILSLPGAWILIAIAVVIELCDGLYLPTGSTTFSLWTFIAAAVIAFIGEILEFVAGAAGAKHGGASKRGMFGALVGGMIGAIAGTVLILIPVIGSILGAVLGAAAGAIVAELTVPGATWRGTLKPAGGAAAGRFAGTIAKLACALVIWIVLSAAIFWP